MAGRMCHLCGTLYTDEEGHNYDICVSRCFDALQREKVQAHKAVERIITAYEHYMEAVHIQKQDWWKEKREGK